jgi:hypothetical protein
MSKSGVAAMVDKAIAAGNLQNPNAAAAAAGTFNSGKYVLNTNGQVVDINYADPSNNADGFKAASSAKLSQNQRVNALRDA